MTEPRLRRIYEDAAYAAESLSGCWWAETCPDLPNTPLSGEQRAEFAVIGAGFTGLSAALHLARSGADVAVLDLHRPGWGASGRNGGFCCLGGAKADGATLARRYGEDQRLAFRRTERRAIEFVSDRIDELGLDVDRQSPGGEIELAHSRAAFRAMQAEQAQTGADYGISPQLLTPDDLRAQGLNAAGMQGGLALPLGFGLNPRKYVLGLARAATQQSIRLHGESPVLSHEYRDGWHVLVTPQGRLLARNLIVATNGYSAENIPEWIAGRILPVQSSIVVTRPLTEAERQAQNWTTDSMAYDSRNLLHYFRLLPDGRMLFGMRGAVRWTAASQAAILDRTRRHFRAMFPKWRHVTFTHGWSGLVAMTRDLVPFVGQMGDLPRAHAAFAWHGNGVAMGSWCGEQVARMALGKTHELPAFMSVQPRRFPLAGWRRAFLYPAYLAYGIKDRG